MSELDLAAAAARRRISAVRGVAAALAVLLALPYLLTLAYLVVPPVSTLMLWRHMTGQRVVRSYVPLENIAPVLVQTVIASEDQRFCVHDGIDWQGLRQVIEEAEEFDDLRGGSTITQQTVKNLFLWPGRSFVRKALEFPLSLWMDYVLPKRRIMEIYLNIAEWGPDGEFGAEAGAQRAFRKPADALQPAEAALLAAVLPNPIVRDARRPGPRVRRLAGLYQRRAVTSGPIADCVQAAPAP